LLQPLDEVSKENKKHPQIKYQKLEPKPHWISLWAEKPTDALVLILETHSKKVSL
jgi:hypothetical protein